MGYVLKAVLSSAQHPEYGQITVPFPIPDEKYDRMIELLEPLEIGDALRQDCRVDELDSFYTVLNRLVGSLVNFDELDYLAKRLDSFDDGEAAQFQGMACKLGVSNIKDFINLTFCCQQATVITDFSDLDAIGRQHYMTMQGGGCRIEELERLDGRKFALDLILNHLEGRITPYGVVYDNGMKLEQLYEGKAKKVFATSDPNVVIVSYKDDATAFNGLKKGTITGKGAINNRMTNNLMRRLEEKGVPTHYVEELSDRETAVKKVSIVPLEVIIRNISAGSFAKRFGVEEGIVFDAPTIEFSYKNDDLGDPLMNSYHALALKLATQEEIDLIKKYAFAVNDLLRGFMKEIGIDLVDFKLEFGKTADGTIVLADEISPDTCRLWDEQTHEKLDKDRFRRDMGGAEEAYEEVMRRLMGDQ